MELTFFFRGPLQHGNFNYDSPMKCFLEAIRDQKLPTDLLEVLDEAGVRYYEGGFSRSNKQPREL